MSYGQKLIAASEKCKWLIFLQTKQALKDKTLTFTVMAALNISIYRKKVKVISVVDRREKLSIPESLRCVTYIPFDTDDNYLEDLHIIVSGKKYRFICLF